MPIYLDRHDAPDEVTAKHVAEMHLADLKHQEKFGCKGFTYWFDEKRKTGFCLIEAPNKQAITAMHNHAHGDVPSQIIEVEKHFVESFLGRLHDPEIAKNTTLNIINDPAFRTLMIIKPEVDSYAKLSRNQCNIAVNDFSKFIARFAKQFEGRVVKHLPEALLSFSSTSNAIYCALKIQSKFREFNKGDLYPDLKLNMALSCGVPVTDKEDIFEEAIGVAEKLCEISNTEIIVSSEVKALFKSENQNAFIDEKFIQSLHPSDENFLYNFIRLVEKTWKNTNLKADDFCKTLGFSKSQFYRKLKLTTGKSPNTFIKDYRLKKAITFLNNKKGNISEIAYETGFNSPAYFSKCFHQKYGVLPSGYINQQEETIHQPDSHF